MSLTAGTLLGPYEVVARLGASGMGAVYRARDTRLGRTVAIKVLPEGTWASDSLGASDAGMRLKTERMFAWRHSSRRRRGPWCRPSSP